MLGCSAVNCRFNQERRCRKSRYGFMPSQAGEMIHLDMGCTEFEPRDEMGQ